MARRFGANVLIDHTQQDPIAAIRALTGGGGADAAIEALGRQETFENALRSIRPGGTLSSLGVYSGKLVAPYEAIHAGLGDQKVELIYTAPQEVFFTQIKLAMFGGLVIAFPLIAGQIYKFVAPGLYKNERRAFLPFLVASPILFLMGGALVYFFFTPMVMWFFLAMQQTGEGGEVQMPLNETFFAKSFGMVADRFGVSWMVIAEPKNP